jgi:hypothetical protein
MRDKKNRAIYQLHVQLCDINPPIWRRIQIVDDTKLPRLHRILQLLFNWEDYHLHEFQAGRRVFCVPDPEDRFRDRVLIDETTVPVNRVALQLGATFSYLYDFGDDWRHEILFEGTLLAEPDAFYPRCIAGARNGPPEDVGGAHGYADYLEALADPDHEEHGEKLAWRGPFDPEAFSLEAINAALKRTFYRRPKSIIPRAKAEGSVTPDAGEDPDVEHLTRFMLAAVRGGSTEAVPKTRIAPGTTLPLELTVRERELILNHSFAPDELTARLRVVPQPGAAECIVRYTLNDLDEFAGFAASESNHASDSKLHKEWERIYVKIAAILECYTDAQQ